jgi:hypothetical protein
MNGSFQFTINLLTTKFLRTRLRRPIRAITARTPATHGEQRRSDDAENPEVQRRAWADGRLRVSAYSRKQMLGDHGPGHARGRAARDVQLLARHVSE